MHASCVPPPHPRPSRLPARTSPPRIACPPFDSAVRVCLQPAAELRHLQRHDHELHVLCALSAHALGAQLFESRAPCMPSLPPCTLCPSLPPPGTHLAPITRPPFDSGSTHPPCPPRTSCSSAARGRAPRPSPSLAMARAGLREAVRERSSAVRERSSARELLRLILIPSRTTTTSSDLDSLVAAGKRDCLCCL